MGYSLARGFERDIQEHNFIPKGHFRDEVLRHNQHGEIQSREPKKLPLKQEDWVESNDFAKAAVASSAAIPQARRKLRWLIRESSGCASIG
jgi:hypothetical protein